MPGAGSTQPPLWFKVAAIVAILWGLAGVYACYTQLTLTTGQLAALPTAQRDAFSAMPGLVKLAYVLATGGGLAGAVMLLARRRAARSAFMLSLAGIVMQFGWVFLAYRGAAALGPSAMIFPAFILGVCLAEIALASVAIKRGWLT